MGVLKLAKVEPHQQATPNNCSAATLHAVMKHHGVVVPEKVLAETIGVNDQGAELREIARAAREHGFWAKEKRFGSLAEAQKILEQGLPIIADVRSWKKPGQGHYVVIASIVGGIAELMDPNHNEDNNWRVMKVDEFDKRWWDWGMESPHNFMRRAGVVLAPKHEWRRHELPF